MARLAMIGVCVMALVGCDGSGEKPDLSRCQPVAPDVLAYLASGIKPETGVTFAHPQAVKSGSQDQLWIVAAALEGPGMKGTNVARFAVPFNEPFADPGLMPPVQSLDSFADGFTDWPSYGFLAKIDARKLDGFDLSASCVKAQE